MKKVSLVATLAATTALSMMALLPSMFPGSASGAIDQPFNYLITADGTENITTYPNQEFTWTVTTTGTETWVERGAYLGQRYVWASSCKQYYTYYLYPAEGSTITRWSHTPYGSRYGGSDNGTYIDYANNRLVIEVYTGGSVYNWCCEWSTGGSCAQWCSHCSPGSYAAMYYIYGDKAYTTILTATESGVGTVNATEGRKFISSFDVTPLSPEHGGAVTVDSRTITDDNPDVTTEISVSTTGSIYASTDYSEAMAQPWSATEAGSASVNVSEGDKYITTSTLVAPNDDTTWSVTDDSDYVDTWMGSNNLYARATNLPPLADANGPYVGDEASEITLDGSGSYDPDGTSLLYEWDLDGDGSYDDATGASPTFSWGDDYVGAVGLRVADDAGLTDTDSTTVIVNNVAPTVDAGPDQTAECCVDAVSMSGSFADPGWLDTHTVHWDFGDGASADGSLEVSHVYSELGTFPATLTITDDDGGVGVEAATVTVVDTTSPDITCPADVIVEGDTTGGATPGAVGLGTATATDVVDPSPAISNDAPGFYPLGDTTVTFTATDDSLNISQCQTIVTVMDTTPPVITCPADVTVEGDTAGGATPGAVGLGAATVTDVVDSSPAISNDAPGFYPLGDTTVIFTATDDSGNASSCQATVTVVDTTPPTITVAGVAQGTEYDNEVTPTVTIEDSASGVDTSSLSLDGAPWVSGSPITEPGLHTLTVEATDRAGNSASASVSFAVYRATSLTVSDATVQHSDPVGLKATLIDFYDNPVEGATLTYAVTAVCSGTAMTDDSGKATYACGPVSTLPAAYAIEVSFAQDDARYLRASSGSGTLTVVRERTVLRVTDATAQYSDSVVLSATLTDDDDPGTALAGRTVSFEVAGACTGGAATDASCVATYVCEGVLLPAGPYEVTVEYRGDVGYEPAMGAGTLEVLAENAAVGCNHNPIAVAVTGPGEASLPFEITVEVTEAQPDSAGLGPDGGSLARPGDIALAVASVTLQPVGPGSSVGPTTCDQLSIDGNSYDAGLTARCTFQDVPVNIYSVLVNVHGGYYSGGTEDVLTVYDPSLGFTTGGGTFLWPGTDDRTNFGFTMKYSKRGRNVKGSLLLVRHLPDGTIYRVKSNALYGLALGERRADGETCGWASFSGKATYLEPGWPEPVGNHQFVAYVEDCDEPGTGVDRFWIQVKDRDRVLIEAMSMEAGAIDNAEELTGGNIVAPHGSGGRKK